ncbi:MAG: 3-phosphoserine/phosphohydroxythreonine transaminase [Bacteroidetes bacterium]|nr:3-phosphoserine/phosphohydroxythreonine transaminase [Bacteroidota bacterium]
MKHNFCSGPSILPQEVFQKAAKAVTELDGIGLSLLEISHRSKEFTSILSEAISLVKELLEVPEGYEVLFLQGGASSQFAMVPMNLMKKGGKAGYVNTGVWTEKAVLDANRFGTVLELASSKDRQYSYIPYDFSEPDGLDYVHIATNNTIYGTEWLDLPKTKAPLVVDASSNIFSKKIDISKCGLVYAGAQKNLGPAGTTLVIVKEELLGKTGRDLPNMFDYRVHIKKGSNYNTPPVFPIYVCLLTLRWLKALGGVPAITKINYEKAVALYHEIDRNSMIYGTVINEDRSRMNVTFRLHDASLESELASHFTLHDIVNTNGHRLVGGFRASLYNAMPMKSVVHLVDVLQEFERLHG